MTATITLERVTLIAPFAVLVFDPVALFVPMSGRAWNVAQPSRREWREALGSTGTMRADHVRFDPDALDMVDIETDCIGRTVIVLNREAIARMALASGHMPLWCYTLGTQDRYGWKPKHMRQWLRTFLRPEDASAVETMLTDGYRRACVG